MTHFHELVQAPLKLVQRELRNQLAQLQGEGEGPVQRLRMSNLIIYCNNDEVGARIHQQIPEVVAVHPARVLLLVGDTTIPEDHITASVQVEAHSLGRHHQACTELVLIKATGPAVDRLPFAVRSLLIGDLPTNLWWAAPIPPAMGGVLLYELAETAQQIIYDSIGWMEPARGMAATASWLANIERGAPGERWRVASDLNWRRLKYWRRIVSEALSPASAPGAAESVSELYLEHGPHAVIQAWELASWVVRRLGWEVQGGKLQEGVEMGWRFATEHNPTRVRIHRRESGPPELCKVRISCHINEQPVVMNLQAESETRLSIILEGMESQARTVTLPPLSAADLVGRQLSDRARDPVFLESMAVAQVMAQGLLG